MGPRGFREPAELVVSFLDRERASMSELPADDFNARAADYFSSHKLENPPILAEDQLRKIRDKVRELHIQWGKLPEDQTMELIFNR
jgi:hypothetical protein